MEKELWRRIEVLFEEVLKRPPDARATFLDSACAGEPRLRAEVEALLDHHDRAEDQEFLKEPVQVASTLSAGSAEPDPLIGAELGPYRIVRHQGGGGMGNVYLATRRTDYRQQVAIKVLRSELDTESILRRFRNEIQILAVLGGHENIAGLLDAGTTHDGLPYFVMDYVDGEPLDSYCDNRNLSIRERIELFRQICGALHFAHQHMVIHRDLKMTNILIGADGVPKLIDFGIAKLTAPELSAQTLVPTLIGLRLMTPAYASPEQVRGSALTATTDIYSLGVVLYELLTGRKPYALDKGPEQDYRSVICDVEPNAPSVAHKDEPSAAAQSELDEVCKRRSTTPKALRRALAGDLDSVVLKALRKEPQRRYTSAEELSADLERYLDGRPVGARVLGAPERVFRWSLRNPVPVALFATVILTLLGGLWHHSRLSDQLIRSAAIEGATLQAQTLEAVQGFYSITVVDKVKNVVPVTHRYQLIHGAIPVPASFTIDLGEHLRKSQTTSMYARLYSDYPFEHRKGGGPKDEFEANALHALRQNPDEPYYRFEAYDGRPSLRYATARIMQPTCVACHNNHPDSTKTDWRDGDVRGVLEIIRPLDADIARASKGLRETFVYMLAISVVLGALAVYFLLRDRRT
jgi:serine/threonine protein kinase